MKLNEIVSQELYNSNTSLVSICAVYKEGHAECEGPYVLGKYSDVKSPLTFISSMATEPVKLL